MTSRQWRAKWMLAAALAVLSLPVRALNDLSFAVTGDPEELTEAIKSASALQAALRDGRTETQDILAAATSDYGQILGALYAKGHYSGVIHILIDGREAASIPALNAPAQISNVVVQVDPGPQFRFGQTRIAPLAPGTELPEGFATGQPALSNTATAAVNAAGKAWRRAGHARVDVQSQKIAADHANRTLSADILLAPGPVVTFGNFLPRSNSNVRPERLREIAGLPTGERYDPDEVEDAAERLRRTGTFRSVRLSEAKTLGPGNTLDIEAQVVDEKPRRFGFGGEISSNEGVTLSGYWLHRNLRGGAERLRFDAQIANIGGQSGGIDYKLGARFDRPASFGPDTAFYTMAQIEHLDEPTYISDQGRIEVGASRIFSKHLTGELGIGINYARIDDSFGMREFTYLSLPTKLRWDHRDKALDPKSGFYLAADAMPYLGVNGTDSGARLMLDGRYYRSLDADGRFVAAARLQFGSIIGSSLSNTQPDLLFYSGGGGTVRGQPYKSLNVDLGGGNVSGGRAFVGLSLEMRAKLGAKWGLVGFADAGYIGAESLYDGSGEWHSGAGIGIRYDTGIGPIRLDVAAPTSGDTGDGVQVYVGIGQAF